MRIVIGGTLAGCPADGVHAWTRLAWIRGLRDLGVDVLFVEELHPPARPDTAECSVAYFRHACAEGGFQGALIHPGGESLAGASTCDVLAFADGADLLVNLDGHLRYPPVLRSVRWRAWVDTEPGRIQRRYAAGEGGLSLRDHERHFSLARNIGVPRCPVPTGGIHWMPVLQPVVLADWPVTEPPPALRFTTIAARQPPPARNGAEPRIDAPDLDELRRFARLPRSIGVLVEVALGEGAGVEDGALLVRNGWRLAAVHEVADRIESLRAYVRTSGAELSFAPSLQVADQTGWISPLSVRYLATGRPVVAQDTGFGSAIPLGEGLLAFRTAREAAKAVKEVVDHYEHHRHAARRLAERYFDSRRVLSSFLDRALAPRRRARGAMVAVAGARRARAMARQGLV